MPVTLPTTRQVFSGAISKLSFNQGRVTGLFLVDLGNRQTRRPFYIHASILERFANFVPGRTRLYGEFRNGTFIVLGPDTRRAPDVTSPMGPVAAALVTGEIYRLEHKINGQGAVYIRAIFRFTDAEGRGQTKTLLVRGGTATALRTEIHEGPMTLEGYVTGDIFEVTGLPRPEAEPGQTRPTGSRAEPAYRQVLDGFWRTLKPGRMGKTRTGEPIEGKTWVGAHTRYAHKPRRPAEDIVSGA